MDATLTIRSPRPRDAPSLLRIYRDAFRPYELFRGSADRVNRNTVVAEVDGRVAGFGCWSVVGRGERELRDLLACLEPDMRAILAPSAGHDVDLPIRIDAPDGWVPRLDRGDWVFSALAVDQPYRRMGVGTALARHRIRRAERAGARRIYLHAILGSGCRQVYERLGFVPLVTKEHHYPDGTGMTLMVNSLRQDSRG